jgi:hypothetical protein
MSTGPARNPLHRLIDILTCYESAFLAIHEAATKEARDQAIKRWRACHPVAWEGRTSRDDAIRNLADPAQAWLSERNSRHIEHEHLELVEECALVVSGFAINSIPMSMPDIYSTMLNTREEHYQDWRRQGEDYEALRRLINQSRRLAAWAGEPWAPLGTAEGSKESRQPEGAEGTGAARDQEEAGQGEGAAVAALSPSRTKALSQYCDAIRRCPELQRETVRAVYDWIAEHNDGDRLLSFATWERYLRTARKVTGTGKNTPRRGRTGRSIVGPDEI